MNVRKFQWMGWILFSVSALAFIAAAWRAGDLISLIGAAAFMAANAAFIVAHVQDGRV